MEHLSFGFVQRHVLDDLSDVGNWKVRGSGLTGSSDSPLLGQFPASMTEPYWWLEAINICLSWDYLRLQQQLGSMLCQHRLCHGLTATAFDLVYSVNNPMG